MKPQMNADLRSLFMLLVAADLLRDTQLVMLVLLFGSISLTARDFCHTRMVHFGNPSVYLRIS